MGVRPRNLGIWTLRRNSSGVQAGFRESSRGFHDCILFAAISQQHTVHIVVFLYPSCPSRDPVYLSRVAYHTSVSR